MSFGGLNFFFSVHALADTTERLFPASRHRSQRVHKKLIKRFGGEFRKTPAMWKTPHGIIAHPSFKGRLQAAVLAEARDA